MKRFMLMAVLGVVAAMVLAFAPVKQVEAASPVVTHQSAMTTETIPFGHASYAVLTHSVQSHLSVSFGWNIYLHLSHDDVVSVNYAIAIVGLTAGLELLCAALGAFNPFAGGACAAIVTAEAGIVGLILGHAATLYDLIPNVYCNVGPSWVCPYNVWWNGFWWWLYYDYGVTFAVSYFGALVGYSYDEGSCPC